LRSSNDSEAGKWPPTNPDPIPTKSPSMGTARGPQSKPTTFSRNEPLWMVAPRSIYRLIAGAGRVSLKANAHFCHCAALSRVASVASAAI